MSCPDRHNLYFLIAGVAIIAMVVALDFIERGAARSATVAPVVTR